MTTSPLALLTRATNALEDALSWSAHAFTRASMAEQARLDGRRDAMLSRAGASLYQIEKIEAACKRSREALLALGAVQVRTDGDAPLTDDTSNVRPFPLKGDNYKSVPMPDSGPKGAA